MRKFQFSLQAALGMRERSVEAAENALREVQEEWNGNQRKQQELTDEVRRAELAVRSGPVDPADYLALDRYRAAAQRQRLRLAQEASEIARRLAERRTAWQEAERDRTLLVRLKEKSLARWQLEYEKEQQRLAEEAFLSRWNSL
jgi:flagellar export protein FliJ